LTEWGQRAPAVIETTAGNPAVVVVSERAG
jgi:hypothetical protein